MCGTETWSKTNPTAQLISNGRDITSMEAQGDHTSISALGTYTGKMNPCKIWFEDQQGLNLGQPKELQET